MSSRHWPRFAAATGILVAFLGAWTAHTLEYLRVAGTQAASGIVPSPFGTVHSYMLPAAAVLLVLGTGVGLQLWKLWWRLAAALERLTSARRRVLRGHKSTSEFLDHLPSAPSRLLAIWIPLALFQMAIYLVQENLEAWVSGRPVLGFGVFTGVHWAAPLIHIGVALFLAVGILLASWPFRRISHAIEKTQQLVAQLVARLRSEPPTASISNPVVIHPVRLFGSALWRRPPPVTA